MQNIMEYAYCSILPLLKQRLGGVPIIPHLSKHQAIMFDVFASPKRMQIIMTNVIDRTVFEVKYSDGQTTHQPYQNLDQHAMLDCVSQLFTSGRFTSGQQQPIVKQIDNQAVPPPKHLNPVNLTPNVQTSQGNGIQQQAQTNSTVISVQPQKIQPIQQVQGNTPAQSLKPLQPVQQVQQTTGNQPVTSIKVQPIQPTQTTQPIQPVQQVHQATPIQPIQITQPAQPIQPVQQATPIQPIQQVQPVQQQSQAQSPLKPIQPQVLGVALKPLNAQQDIELPKILPSGNNVNISNPKPQQSQDKEWENVNQQARKVEKEQQEREEEERNQGLSMEDDNDIDGNDDFKATFKGMIKSFNKKEMLKSEVMSYLENSGVDTQKNKDYFEKYAKKHAPRSHGKRASKK